MAHDHATPPRAEGDGPGYETLDVNPRSLMTFGVILTAFLAVTIIATLGVYKLFINEKEPVPVLPAVAPNLDIYDVLRDLRASEKEQLTTYGWVDRKAGVVRIPIERALDLAAQRGIPHGKGPRTEAELNSHAGTPAAAVEAAPAPKAEAAAPKAAEGDAAKSKDVKP